MGVTTQNYGVQAGKPIVHNGETRTLKDWCRHLDLDYAIVRMRFKRGKTAQDDLFHPTARGFFSSVAVSDNALPSFYYTVSHELKLRLMQETNGNREHMYKILIRALSRELLPSE